MKRILFVLVVLAAIAGCMSSDKKRDTGKISLTEEEKEKAAHDSLSYTTIKWLDSTAIQLGKVKKGEIVEVSFPFKNTGDKQLIITNVTAGCGCTIPEKPEQPFAPGAEGEIKARFDSKNQHPGAHTKMVTVGANTNPSTIHHLQFSVEITE